MRVVLFFLALVIYSVPLLALAAASNIDQILQNAINALWTIGVGIIVIMTIWTAILYAVSVGDPNKMTMAKNSLIYTITAAFVLFLSFSLAQVVKGILGV